MTILIVAIVIVVFVVLKTKCSGNKPFRTGTILQIPTEEALKEDKYVVLDVETTGLSPTNDRIIEIAAIKFQGGEKIGRYETLVNPGKKLPPEITALTGIRPEMLKSAKPYKEMGQEISEFIEGFPIVAHNSAFDANFVSAAITNAGKYTVVRHIDTIPLAKEAFPGMPNYKLATLISQLHLSDHVQTHRAMDDVLCTEKLYRMCGERIQAANAILPQFNTVNSIMRSLPSTKTSAELFLAYEKATSAIKTAQKKSQESVSAIFGDGSSYISDAFSDAIFSMMEIEYSREMKAIQKLKTTKAMDSHIEKFRSVYEFNADKLTEDQKQTLASYTQDLELIRDMSIT